MIIKNTNDLKNAYLTLYILLKGDIKRKVSHHKGIEILKREIRRFNK